MIKIKLTRLFSSKYGTLGLLNAPGFFCFALEPPWLDNKVTLSSIPAGIYSCKQIRSPKFGWVYEVQNVSERSHILIHSGNLAGHRSLGLITHTWGCLLLGSRVGWLNNQLAVLNSRTTVRKLTEHLNKQPFTLEVTTCLKQ